MFNAEEYKKLLASSESIADVEAVPLPVVREDQNYIFISYSHKDYKEVYSDLADMYAAGVRFWYDRGLKPGKDWDAMVLEKIQSPHCSGVIFYLSKNLFLSSAIKREISIVTGHDEITGHTDAGAKAYFSVNLTDGAPSDIVFSITAEKKQEKKLDSRWLKLLMDSFSDESTYLRYTEPNHSTQLIESICDTFNVVNEVDVIVMAMGDYTGEMLGGRKHGKGTFTYTTGHVYEGQWQDDQRCGTGTLSRNGKVIYQGQWQDDKINGYGEYTYNDGTVYKGDWKDNLREGQGTYTYASGAVYEGQWKNGQRHGQGTYIYGDAGEHKRRYVGQWTQDRMEGVGLFTYSDLSTYEGGFVNWKKDGYGIRKYANGIRYEGQWVQDKQHGQGTFTYEDGKAWTGEFKDDNKWTGQGFLYYYTDGERNGKTYDGEMKEGKYHGRGVLHYANGAVYDGQWENDQRHGQGSYTYADEGEDKRNYVGQWTNDRMEGKGLFTYKDKSTYEGDFVDWKFDGYGIRKYANGTVYEGHWVKDKQQGQGVYTYADGKQWAGEFQDDKMWTGKGFLYYYKDGKLTGKTYDGERREGKFWGYGVCTYVNGAVYDGQWENDQRHGQGTYIYADEGEEKRRYVGQWTNDRMEGKGLFTYKDKSTYEGDFVDWKFEGNGVRKYANGDVYEGQWKQDKRNGFGTCTYANGTKYEGQWKDGKCQGQGIYTYPDGKQWVGEFENGEKWNGNGFLYYYTNGKLNGKTYVGELRQGVQHGQGRYDYGDGSFYDGQWESGRCEGYGLYEWVSLSDDEGPVLKAQKEGLWKDGSMIEGRRTMLMRIADGPFKETGYCEGKWDYTGNLLGVIKVKTKRRVRTKLNLPGASIYLPNWWIFRLSLEGAIWQFEGESSKTPEGYGKATLYDGTVIEGWFRNGKVMEEKPCTVTYTDGTVQSGIWRKGGLVMDREQEQEGS